MSLIRGSELKLRHNKEPRTRFQPLKRRRPPKGSNQVLPEFIQGIEGSAPFHAATPLDYIG